ncbi:MAG: transglutaminase domain-containing protein [Bacteroidota bacterium]
MKFFTGMIGSTRKTGFYLLFIFWVITHSNALAQLSPIEAHKNYRSSFPEESGIVTEYRKVIEIKRKGDSLDISAREYREILVLDKPSRWVKEKVYSSAFAKVEEVKAYTLLPAKKKYRKVPVEDFKKSFNKDSYIFYDDTEVINFNFPQLVEGAKIVTESRKKFKDPRLLTGFYFASYIPTLSSTLELKIEDGIEIVHGLINDSLANITFSESLENGVRNYTYTVSDLPKVDYEDDSPGFGYLSPSAYVLIASYTNTVGETVPVLSSLDDLHSWYKGFLVDLELGNDVNQVSKNIVEPDDQPIEKVRKIFYWVQEHIKYIAFENGMRGFVPHPADYVLEKRYGDCKDMTSLLVGMLKNEGIDANFTWIGTRELPHKYTELPSPIVDNHMIASVNIDGKVIFLDATGSYTPLGLPTAMIQGKESLISTSDGYKIVPVPVIEKEKNQMNDSSTIWLEDGVIYGNGEVTLSGLAQVANSYKLIQKTTRGEDNYVRRLLSRGNNTFLVDDYDVKNLEDLDQPIKIKYQFNVSDHYREVGDEIYINLCLDRSLVNRVIKDRKVPLENSYKYITSSFTALKIPQGYRAKFVPEGGKFNSNDLGFEITYEQSGNSIIFSSKIFVDYLIMNPSSFKDWNEVIKAYSKLTRKTIVLEKI